MALLHNTQLPMINVALARRRRGLRLDWDRKSVLCRAGLDCDVTTRPAGDDAKRLGRAVVFVHQHDAQIVSPQLRAEIEILLLTGRAMDFAARIKGHEQLVALTHELVHGYGKYAGLGGYELINTVLPKLKAADLIDYRLDNQGRIVAMEEFVGVSASVIEQTVAVQMALPDVVDHALTTPLESTQATTEAAGQSALFEPSDEQPPPVATP